MHENPNQCVYVCVSLCVFGGGGGVCVVYIYVYIVPVTFILTLTDVDFYIFTFTCSQISGTKYIIIHFFITKCTMYSKIHFTNTCIINIHV